MSHVKNVAALEKLLGYCSGYGGYNPGLKNLTVQSMSDLLEKARQAVQEANASKTDLNNETNEREIFFANLRKLTSSIVLALEVSGVSEQTMKDARGFFRQITRRKLKHRESVPPDNANEAVQKKSPIQGGYVNAAGQFAKLVELVSNEPHYQPNEPHLQREALRAALEKMNGLNSEVANRQIAWSNARVSLNNELYADETSLYVTARMVRKYVRATFGFGSSQYEQLKSIQFTKPHA